MLSIEQQLTTNRNGLSIEKHIVPPPPAINTCSSPTAILDSGATSHFVTRELPLLNIRQAPNPISVLVPNGDSMHADHVATLDLPQFSPAATTAHVLPDMASGSLLSVGQVADDGCYIIFSATEALVTRSPPILTGPIELTATRAPGGNSLYLAPIPNRQMEQQHHQPMVTASPVHAINQLTPSTTVRKQLVWLHGALGSPTHSTLIAAIEAGYLTTFPHLTVRNVRRFLPQSRSTIQGHLDQSRANQRSTQPRPPALPPVSTPTPSSPTAVTHETATDTRPTPLDPPAAPTHHLYAECMPFTGEIFTDQTGRFLCPSTAGNTDMLVLYDYDTNAIHVEPMKGKSSAAILAAYATALDMLTRRGHKPKLQKLDNEASAALLKFIEHSDIEFQLAPPQTHRRNAAERAIRTFKNHFISMLCSTDKDFPLKLWDRLIPQALISLNLVRGSRVNPALSAYAQLYGAFDYNRTPLAPPGIRVLVHEKPTIRETWAPHAVDGWYIGPAMHHYRCFRVWIDETQAERTSDTVAWFPTKFEHPQSTPLEEATAAARDLIRALQNPDPGTPLFALSDSNRTALSQLADIFAAPGAQADNDDPIVGAPPPVNNLPAAEQRVAMPPADEQDRKSVV